MESITLKMLRERCNLTQQQVADILNKSVSAYFYLMNDIR